MDAHKAKFMYWFRWISLLPGTILAGILSAFPVHWILYMTLTGSGIIKPYPELPERILTPFAFGLIFVWAPYKIAPTNRYKCSIAFFALWIIIWGVFLAIAIMNVNLFGLSLTLKYGGVAFGMGFVGSVVGLLIVKHQNRAEVD